MELIDSTHLSVEPEIIHVACAIIEGADGVLCALCSATMSLPLVWEFPGGKIEPGESPVEALPREIAEELSAALDPLANLPKSDHSYVPGRILRPDEHPLNLFFSFVLACYIPETLDPPTGIFSRTCLQTGNFKYFQT